MVEFIGLHGQASQVGTNSDGSERPVWVALPARNFDHKWQHTAS